MALIYLTVLNLKGKKIILVQKNILFYNRGHLDISVRLGASGRIHLLIYYS